MPDVKTSATQLTQQDILQNKKAVLHSNKTALILLGIIFIEL